MNIQGTASLITGASRGLGRALAQALAARGSRVALVARDRAALEETVAAIRATGAEAHAIVADVADRDATYAIAGQAAALIGSPEIVVHNAASLGTPSLQLLLDTACEDLERALAVNVLGPFRLTKALAGPMILRGHGLIVNVSSDAATEPYEGWGAYGASKAALEQLARIWAVELRGTGVRMLTVDPGEMDTALHRAAMPDADRSSLGQPPLVARQLVELIQGDLWSAARVSLTGPRA